MFGDLWKKIKKPFVSAGKTIGSWFAKEKEPTAIGYKPYKAKPVETMAQLFGVGKRPSAIRETVMKKIPIMKKFPSFVKKVEEVRKATYPWTYKKIAALTGKPKYTEPGAMRFEIGAGLKPKQAAKAEKYVKEEFIPRAEKEAKVVEPIAHLVKGLTQDWGGTIYEPKTVDQKIAYYTGKIASYVAISKVGGAVLGSILPDKLLTVKEITKLSPIKRTAYKLATEAIKHPWKVGYPLAIAKGGAFGATVGAIRKTPEDINKGKDIFNYALGFAAFTAATYPAGMALRWLYSLPANEKVIAINQAKGIFKKHGIPLDEKGAHAKLKVLAQTYHPDRPGGDAKIMTEINTAYETLIKKPYPKIYDIVSRFVKVPEKGVEAAARSYGYLLLPDGGRYIKPIKGAGKIIKYELPKGLMPARGKPTWTHSKMLWNIMRNQYGQTNALGESITKNKGAVGWVIDTLEKGTASTKDLLTEMKKYDKQNMTTWQYKKLYAMFKAHDYDIEGYKKVVATLKGIEPVVTEITPTVKPEKGPESTLKEIPTLYHGTEKENILRILKEGFKATEFLLYGYPQGIFFTTTPAEAENYGMVLKTKTDLKPSDFFDISGMPEFRKVTDESIYLDKLARFIRKSAEKQKIEVPEATEAQKKEFYGTTGIRLKDSLDIAQNKTQVLERMGYKGFIAPQIPALGGGKEIVIFNPEDIKKPARFKPEVKPPATLYHGTPVAGAVTERGLTADSFLTTRKEAAEFHGEVLEVDVSDLNILDAMKEKTPLAKEIRTFITPPRDVGPAEVGEYMGKVDAEFGEKFKDRIIEAGYDGVNLGDKLEVQIYKDIPPERIVKPEVKPTAKIVPEEPLKLPPGVEGRRYVRGELIVPGDDFVMTGYPETKLSPRTYFERERVKREMRAKRTEDIRRTDEIKGLPLSELSANEIRKTKAKQIAAKIRKIKIKNLPLEYKDQVGELLKDFDLKFRTGKTLAKRATLRNYVESLKDEGLLVEVPEEMIEIAERMPLNNMTPEQLEMLYSEVAKLVHLGRMKNKLISVQVKKKVTTLTKELTDQLSRGMAIKEPAVITKEAMKEGWRERMAEKVGGFFNRTDRVERILLKLDGYTEGGKMQTTFYKPINEATDNKIKGVMKVSDEFNDLIKKNKIDLSKILTEKQQFTPDVILTPSEKIGIYLHSLNKDNLIHLKYGNKIDDKLIERVVKSLTPAEKKIASFLKKYFKEEGPAISKVRTLVEGKSLGITKDYFPIRLQWKAKPAINFEEQLSKEESRRFIVKWASSRITKSFLKERSHKAAQAVEMDSLSIFLDHLEKVEHYKAFAPIVRDLQLIIKQPNFRKALESRTGKSGYDVLNTWLKQNAETNPMRPLSSGDAAVRSLRVNATSAVLGINLTTAVKQFASWFNGMAEVGELPVIKGLLSFVRHPKKVRGQIKEFAPQIYRRSFEREIAEAKLMKSLDKKLTQKLSPREVFMFLTTTADKITVSSIWKGAFNDYLKKNPDKPKEAGEYATKAIRRTQPFFSTKDLPEYYRSGEFMKALLTFTNQLNQNWNYYRYDIWGKYAKKKIPFSQVVRKTIEAFILPALIIGWASRSRPAKNIKEFAGDLTSQTLAIIPIFGSWLASGYKGFRNGSVITTEALQTLSDVSYRISKEQWDEVVKTMPELAGYALGIPVIQPKRIFDTIVDMAKGETDDWMRFIWGEYTREKAKAEKKGETKEDRIKALFETKVPEKEKTKKEERIESLFEIKVPKTMEELFK